MKYFCFHTYFLFVTSFGFATYFRVNLASNALHRKANSFTLTKSKFSRNLMEQSDFFLCHTDNVSIDSMLLLPPPFCCPSLPSIKFKGSADCLQSQIIHISDLLFPCVSADCIHSCDLTCMTKSCTLHMNCQIQCSILETYHQKSSFQIYKCRY